MNGNYIIKMYTITQICFLVKEKLFAVVGLHFHGEMAGGTQDGKV
jgi:hypothetical protein